MFKKIINELVTLNRKQKVSIMICADLFLICFSLWSAYSLQLSLLFWPNTYQIWLFLIAIVIGLPTFFIFKLYRSIIRYMGYKAMLAIILATAVTVFCWLIVLMLLNLYVDIFTGAKIQSSLPILFWLVMVLLFIASRQCARWILNVHYSDAKRTQKMVVYGAGSAGRQVVASLIGSDEINVIGFLDDNPSLKGHLVNNYEVLGDYRQIPFIRQAVDTLTVLLATPNMSKKQRRKILNFLEDEQVSVRTLPSMHDIAARKVSVSDIQDINLEDLLERNPIPLDPSLMSACITDKNVLVTGAGGSIGSELCRQILQNNPKKLVLLDHAEFNLYLIHSELIKESTDIDNETDIVPILGTIINFSLIKKILETNKIETIYHAAAYKHVPLVELNVIEGINNNVLGTYNIATLALENNVNHFVLISSDKAVRPTNVMGATKRLAELVVQGISQTSEANNNQGESSTIFTMVRFGNVLGSSGSVIPLFKQQISTGGPVTVTHPEIIRYFMTITEAAQLVIQAGAMCTGGEVFVLDMGKPISIDKLARRMARLSGYQIATNDEEEKHTNFISIVYTGLREGEKLYEELLIGNDVETTSHPKVFKAQEECLPWPEVEKLMDEIKIAVNESDKQHIQNIMVMNVQDYLPEKN